MANPLVASAAIQGGSNLFGQLASNVAMNRNLRLQNKYNKEMADYQYAQDTSFWNKQNQYNSPAAQMERYRAAGLNPNMIYGTGTASAGNATTLPKYSAPEKRADFKPMIPDQMPNIIGTYQDIKLKNAQIDNVKAQTEATINQGLLRAFELSMQQQFRPQNEQSKQTNIWLRNFVTDQQGKLTKHQANMAEIKNDQYEQELNLRRGNLAEQNKNISARTRLLDQQIIFEKFRNQFAKIGVTTSDNVLVRLATSFFQDLQNKKAKMPDLNKNSNFGRNPNGSYFQK